MRKRFIYIYLMRFRVVAYETKHNGADFQTFIIHSTASIAFPLFSNSLHVISEEQKEKNPFTRRSTPAIEWIYVQNHLVWIVRFTFDFDSSLYNFFFEFFWSIIDLC